MTTEDLGAGYDRVITSVSLTGAAALAVNVEYGELTGASALSLDGNAGDNTLVGNSAGNTLTGFGGNDIIDGRGGADAMIGGQGSDTYYVNNAGDVVTEGNGLNDGAADVIFSTVTLASLALNVEYVTLAGTAHISVTGNGLANTLTGNTGNNTLTGLGGNDILDGKSGADAMIGGSGDDVYNIDNASDVVTEVAGEGTADVVYSSITIAALAAEVETAVLLGSSALGITGNAQANYLIGNSGANALSGAGGNDQLRGGLGVDILTGGANSDTFVFVTVAETGTTAGTRDVIADFVQGTDRISVYSIDANSVGGTANDAFTFVGAFSNVAGQLTTITDGGNTVVQGDVDGNSVADFQIQLTGLFTLNAADFIL